MTGTPTKPPREVNETIIGDQGGYFDLVVKPVLQKGHEGELCSWLKEMCLIRTFTTCTNAECKGKNLTWNPARIIDKYIWQCSTPGCGTKVTIRDQSFFDGIKCGLKLCLQAILAWCQGIETDVTAENLNLKEHFVRKVYEKCEKVTELYIKKHANEWTIGGAGVVVVVDEFPGGYMKQNGTDVTVTKKRNNNANNILCIAEAGETIPPRMWFHVFKSHPEPVKSKTDKPQLKNEAVEEALQQIRQHVVPESFIVANSKARSCNYESLADLKGYGVVSVEFLQKYDVPGKAEILKNLETIWQTGIDVCEEVQEATPLMTEQIISSYLWRQRFCTSPSMAFQYMLNHISEFNKFT